MKTKDLNYFNILFSDCIPGYEFQLSTSLAHFIPKKDRIKSETLGEIFTSII